MGIRVTAAEVRKVIDIDSDLDLTPFIVAASSLTDEVSSYATNNGESLSASRLKSIELYLSAHFAEPRDPQYSEKKTGGASAVFQGQTTKGLDGSKWGQIAKSLDTSGFLSATDKGARAGGFWLGKAPSDQTDYVDRD